MDFRVSARLPNKHIFGFRNPTPGSGAEKQEGLSFGRRGFFPPENISFREKDDLVRLGERRLCDARWMPLVQACNTLSTNEKRRQSYD